MLAQLYAKGKFDSVSVKGCDYSNINQEVNQLLDHIEMAERYGVLPVCYRQILITDISVDCPTAYRLDKFQKEREDASVVLLDHHQVVDDIKNTDWVHINTANDQCGTTLLFDYLHPTMNYLWDCRAVSSFVNDVCLYDTWRFDKTKETNSENLSILLGLLGADEFESMINSWIHTKPDLPFEVRELDIYPFVEHEHKRRKAYCSLRNQTMKRIQYKGYTVGVTFAEQHISSVGDYILKENPDIDLCAIVNLPRLVSLRARRDDINVGIDIARPLGGGGHPKAAGYQLIELPEDLIKKLIKMDKEEHI